MKTFKSFLIVLLSVLAMSSCSTDKSFVAKGIDLNKYEYASVSKSPNIRGAETDIEIESGVYEAVESTRLQMVGERRINDLPENQKTKLVLVKYSATSSEDESTISVSFDDYMTGKTVASCRASNKGAWNRQRDVDKAIRKLTKRIRKIWN